ncbi:MAG TPA: hypothetical protein VHZ95_02525, partial [Polyangiales bacterium]|nr:hypothetical protein [Polyangiales bacterium]
GEVLSSGRLVAMGRTAFLVAALPGQRRLLEELGDARAFERVSDYLRSVEEIVAAEGGALVKTASGTTLCAFESAAAAARAALLLRDRFDPGNANDRRDPLDVRLVVHQGPTVAATLDGRLDYFGKTVESALDLIAQAPAQQVLLSSVLAEDQNAMADVTAAGYSLKIQVLHAQGDFALLAVPQGHG